VTPEQHAGIAAVLEAALLCNDSHLGKDDATGEEPPACCLQCTIQELYGSQHMLCGWCWQPAYALLLVAVHQQMMAS